MGLLVSMLNLEWVLLVYLYEARGGSWRLQKLCKSTFSILHIELHMHRFVNSTSKWLVRFKKVIPLWSIPDKYHHFIFHVTKIYAILQGTKSFLGPACAHTNDEIYLVTMGCSSNDWWCELGWIIIPDETSLIFQLATTVLGKSNSHDFEHKAKYIAGPRFLVSFGSPWQDK